MILTFTVSQPDHLQLSTDVLMSEENPMIKRTDENNETSGFSVSRP
jgi:hypothetical protein